MIGPEPICEACQRFRGEPFQAPTCAAFPDGIPGEIATGFDHRQPYPGDHGVRFERDPTRPMPHLFRNE